MTVDRDNERIRNLELTQETWRIFRIMAELVDGFEMMSLLNKPTVTVFGSACTTPDDKYYKHAVELGSRFAQAGFATITGGGPGIMEAINKGAFEAGGESIGLNISLPMEQDPNPYQTRSMDFRYFFVRKLIFVKYAKAFVNFPGGFGTMDEFFESMTLIQTEKIEPFPVILFGSDFWTGLVDWMKDTMLDTHNNIDPKDLDLFTITDDVDEVVRLIAKHFERKPWQEDPYGRTI